jgi:pimeloyl-ACP methyl ester carboxylesterase/protein-disulfide isomerase-like protein with CxxC motif
MEDDVNSKRATVRGIPMRWEEQGEGFPVVFVHGIPTSPALWRKVLPLVEGARCLAWEMVGYGESIPSGRGRDISVARQADYLLAWLESLGIDQAVFVGHDLGGGVVQIAAVREPDRCAGLVLTNAIGYDSWPIPAVKAMRGLGGLIERLPDRAVRPMIAPLFHLGHDDAEIARESLEIHWRHYERHGAAEALIHQMRSLDVEDTLRVQDELSSLDVPSRVVWGMADQFQEAQYGERFAWDLGTTLRPIEAGKHWTPEDHPGEVAAAVREVLAEVRAPSTRRGRDGVERVRFHFDPICPWCYQTSRWLKRVEALGAVELSWGLFSLELQNADGDAEYLEGVARSALALSVAVAVREQAGSRAVGDYYGALGARVHERGEPVDDPAVVRAALEDIGLDPGLVDRADDGGHARQVQQEHAALVEQTRSFGVPTMVLDAGRGPAVFGPVITEPPASDEEALELFRHVVWLARYENFSELKRDRTTSPDLASVRQWQRERQRA